MHATSGLAVDKWGERICKEEARRHLHRTRYMCLEMKWMVLQIHWEEGRTQEDQELGGRPGGGGQKQASGCASWSV